jgi:hypothetical protein
MVIDGIWHIFRLLRQLDIVSGRHYRLAFTARLCLPASRPAGYWNILLSW